MKVKLEEVCKRIYAGGDVPKDSYSKIKTDEYSVPIYANAEKDDGLYGYTDKAREKDLSITVAARGTIGYTSIRREPFLPVVRLITVVPDTEKISERYLYYVLKQCKPRSNGTSIPQLTVPDIKKNSFELYEISEQIKIADRLDKVSKLINLRMQELSALDNLIKARFVEMFGDIATGNYKYDTRKLGDVANVGSSHRVFTTEFVKKGIPFYRGTEIGELANGNKPAEPFYISEEHYNRLVYNDTKPQVGDLLLPSICNKGQVWMVDTDEPFYYKDGRVLCISPDREIFDTKYLEYFMKAKTLVEYPKLGSGSTFAEFKIFLLKNIDVLIPPRELQEQFSMFVHQVDKSKFEELKVFNLKQKIR